MPRFRVWSALWTDFPEQAQQLARGPGVTRVCELGGGANPIIPLELIAERGLEHEVADISAEELAKSPEGYRTVQADATSPDFEARGPYDLIVTASSPSMSRIRARSIPWCVLRSGPEGSLSTSSRRSTSPPSSPTCSSRSASPSRSCGGSSRARESEGAHAKFHAYYRWCRGPTRRQIRRFERGGFEVLDYVGYFGHGYFGKVSPLGRAEQALSRALARHPVPALTSYSTVVLRRPESDPARRPSRPC